MPALLKRLVASSAAYQAASLLSSAIAVITLPLYTHHVGTDSYGCTATASATTTVRSIQPPTIQFYSQNICPVSYES